MSDEERITMLEARLALLTEALIAIAPDHVALQLLEGLDYTGWTPEKAEEHKVSGYMANDGRTRRQMFAKPLIRKDGGEDNGA